MDTEPARSFIIEVAADSCAEASQQLGPAELSRACKFVTSSRSFDMRFRWIEPLFLVCLMNNRRAH